MRSYSFLSAFYRLCALIASAASIVAALAVVVLRIDYGYAWRFVREIGITAYRKISALSPEYQASYDTHGLSLDHRMRC